MISSSVVQHFSAKLSCKKPTSNRASLSKVSSRRGVVVKAAAIEVPIEYRKVTPLADRVFVKVADAETKTSGGVLLPGQAGTKPTSGDIVSMGAKTELLKVGDTVLYSKFGIGCTDVELQGEAYVMIAEKDIIGKMPTSGATASDIPEMTPLGDRIMIKLEKAAEATAGGLILSEGSREKPIGGTVVKVGSGTKKEPMEVKVGQQVVYFKYAGDSMTAADGTEYCVLHQRDVLGAL